MTRPWRLPGALWCLALALSPLTACRSADEIVATKPHGNIGRFVDVEGIRTYYEHAGAASPTVVLVHGLGASTYTFHKTIEPLAEHCSVYAFDLKGFGATDKPSDGYSLDAMRDHARGFLDAMGIERAVLVGHSMGGEIAIRLALQQPERVQALVLIDAAGFLKPEDKDDATGGSVGRLFSEEGLLTWESVQAYGTPLLSRGGLNGLLKRVRAADWGGVADRIPEITAPVLVLWGAEDPLIPASHAERFREALPDARVTVYPGCSHRPTIECADAVNRDLIQFITALDADAPASSPM